MSTELISPAPARAEQGTTRLYYLDALRVIASFVVKWDAGIPLKMLVVVPGSFFVSWALVEFVVKRVGILRFLFGMTSTNRETGSQVNSQGLGSVAVKQK